MNSGVYPRRATAWTVSWAVFIVIVVVASGVGVWWLSGREGKQGASAAAPTSVAPRLVRGNDYYLYIKLIEVSDKAPNGSVWDRLDKSGPDLAFRLTWRKNVIWNSTVKHDTLIGSWDLMRIDLKQVVMSGGQADLEGALNAPLIHFEPGETVKLNVWDADPLGAYDDAGTIILRLDDLSPGENFIAPDGDKAKAIRRVVLSLIDRRTPVPELIETMSNR